MAGWLIPLPACAAAIADYKQHSEVHKQIQCLRHCFLDAQGNVAEAQGQEGGKVV